MHVLLVDVSCDRLVTNDVIEKLVTHKNLDFRDELKKEKQKEGETKLNGVEFWKNSNCRPALTSADSSSQ